MGLLQQDAGPHPPHRQGPQGLSHITKLTKSARKFSFGYFFALVRSLLSWRIGVKDFTWYENGQKRQKVFHTSFCFSLGTERGIFMLSMKRHGFPFTRSGEPCLSVYALFLCAMFAFDIVPIFDPTCGIVDDIFPNLLIIFLVSDHMLMISALPELYAASAVCKAFER